MICRCVPYNLNNSVQNIEVNCTSLSLTMDFGTPNVLTQLFKNICAVRSAAGIPLSFSVVVGMIFTYLVNLSTITTMPTLPDIVRGKWVMKSIHISSKGFCGMDRGCSNPPGR